MNLIELMYELQSVDTVKLVLTNVGESTYESKEVFEAIYKEVKRNRPLSPTKSCDPLTRECHYLCPVCESEVEYNYCPLCGQAIKWEVEE